MFRILLDRLLNIVFPRICVGCGILNEDVCAACLARAPLADQSNLRERNIITLFSYQHETIKHAIWALKYGNRRDIAKVLGNFAHAHLAEELAERATFENFTDVVLVPIPLSKKRRHERGYNQSALLAHAIAQADYEYFSVATDALVKIRDTESQMKIRERKKRLANLRGAFIVDKPELVRGRNIIVIDDIVTTGATITEAKRALLDAGAKRVIGLAVAH